MYHGISQLSDLVGEKIKAFSLASELDRETMVSRKSIANSVSVVDDAAYPAMMADIRQSFSMKLESPKSSARNVSVVIFAFMSVRLEPFHRLIE